MTISINTEKKCKDCVFWIQNRCDGEATPCEYLETYDDWDRAHVNIGEL